MNEINQMTVIGGGIIGLSAALRLQSKGVQVLILEKNTIGSGASLGNAGHLAMEQVYPVADPSILKTLPKMLLDPLGPLRVDWRYLWHLMPWMLKLVGNMRPMPFQRIHETLTSMNAEAYPAWEAFIKKWQLSDLVHIKGSLLVAETEKSLAKLKKHGQQLCAIGVENEWVSAKNLQEREPAISASQLGGLFYPKTGHVVDIKELINQLKNKFLLLGGKIEEEMNVKDLYKETNNQVRIVSDEKYFLSNNVLIACGAYSKKITEMISRIKIPLDTERGYHLMLPTEKSRLSIPISSADRRFIMTPMNSGLRLAGTVEFAGLERPPNMQRALNLLSLANPMFKQALDTEGNTPWMGFRPTLPDSLPIIDRKDNVYFAFGHQHLGLTHAPYTAKIIESLFFNKPPSLNYKNLSIDRFL